MKTLSMLSVAAALIMPISVHADQAVPITNYNLDLPQPLSDADVKRYQQIFALQQDKK